MLIYWEEVHIIYRKREALVNATRLFGLEVCTDKTKYMVMSRDQNAGQNHSARIDNINFESFEEFIYLGTTLKYKILFGKNYSVD